ncbi:XdhC family protein [Rhizobium sp. 11_C7_N12_5]|uniref:XdhC family protein n=1 Tax=Rhizobium sp. 11_C7_N12_5 TaxID=3240770 RepID=UPI003F268790
MTDDPAHILGFAISAFARGPVALATLVEIRGGAARALGAHIAISADRRFCGYVSGGCIEAAVAAEAMEAMAVGCDRSVMFGDGSPFFDIVLPCGGGITVAIHLLREVGPLRHLFDCLAERNVAALQYCPRSQSLTVVDPPARAGWHQERFTTVYRPQTRVIVSSHSIEAERVARLASVANFEVVVLDRGATIDDIAKLIDPHTAVALLHHDLDAEALILAAALRSRAFYIGALGSTRTHRKRRERLRADGFSEMEVDRIKAPIGIFGPTKDSTSLALSVLADIAATRLALVA